jgi:hypothetical protein
VFGNWSDGGTISHTITVPAASTTYIANFATRYLLTTSVSGPNNAGTINASPASADGYYDSSRPVQLTAIANSGYSFSGWSGDLAGSANPQLITMSAPRNVTAGFSPQGTLIDLALNSGGAATASTAGTGSVRSGYASISLSSGPTPYGTAIFTFRQNGVVVSEAGVPASPPTTSARIFIEFRTAVPPIPARSDSGTVNINTGIAVVNSGSENAKVTYTLRDSNGISLAVGTGRIEAGRHVACFIDQLKNELAPDFSMPPDFQTSTQLGSLDIVADKPLSVLGLRGTMNQRNEFLITSTPVADLTSVFEGGSAYFPQFVDGGGYTTSLILLNTSNQLESGTLQIRDKDGNPLVVNQAGGSTNYLFRYAIPPGGFYRFQTDGFPSSVAAGWVRLIADSGTNTPVGSGVFGYNPGNVLVSESGIPSGTATMHARIYVDLSGNHNTGLAIANIVSSSGSSITINAYQIDGVTAAGNSMEPIPLAANGYKAAFADQFVTGLPEGFSGVLDIRSTAPFAALTLRSLVNERDEFLMTTFPVADANQPAPSPMIFPHIADGGGYTTEFILLSPGGAATTTLHLYDETGNPMEVSK